MVSRRGREPVGQGGSGGRAGPASVRTLVGEVAKRVEDERRRGGPHRDLADLARRVTSAE
jgi:hypothetical protein